jgi:hypothetical protein
MPDNTILVGTPASPPIAVSVASNQNCTRSFDRNAASKELPDLARTSAQLVRNTALEESDASIILDRVDPTTSSREQAISCKKAELALSMHPSVEVTALIRP